MNDIKTCNVQSFGTLQRLSPMARYSSSWYKHRTWQTGNLQTMRTLRYKSYIDAPCVWFLMVHDSSCTNYSHQTTVHLSVLCVMTITGVGLHRRANGWQWIMKCILRGQKRSWPNKTYYAGSCLGGTDQEKPQDSSYPCRYSNLASHKYKSETSRELSHRTLKQDGDTISLLYNSTLCFKYNLAEWRRYDNDTFTTKIR
jgi:hypothetical protein